MTNKTGLKPNYRVVKDEDISQHLSFNQQGMLNHLLSLIQAGRAKEGKTRDNEYIVVNTDEPYIQDIVDVLKENGHWDGNVPITRTQAANRISRYLQKTEVELKPYQVRLLAAHVDSYLYDETTFTNELIKKTQELRDE